MLIVNVNSNAQLLILKEGTVSLLIFTRNDEYQQRRVHSFTRERKQE